MEQNQVTDEEIRNVRNTVVGKDYVKIWSKMLYYLCTELLYLREAKRMALRAAPEHEVADDRCPNCWRKKAHSADDCLDGKCPKWFAVRDSGAEDDCTLFNKAFFSPPAGQGATAQPAHGEREPDDEAMVPRQPNPDLFCGNVAVSNDPRYAGWVFVRHVDGVNWITCAKMSDATWQMLKSYWGGK